MTGSSSRSARAGLALLASLSLLAALPHRVAAAAYHVVARWTIGGEGGWDYLTADAATRRLYVTHNTQVEVLDLDSGKKLGAIPGTVGAHGVALAPPLNRGYITSGRDSAIVVFDLKTLSVVSRIHVPARGPDAILYEPVTKRVFSFNGGSANTCAFDAASGAFLDSLALGGKPEFCVADGAGRVFVNLEDSSAVVVFDAKTLRVARRSPLAPGEEPSGLAMDHKRGVLFSGCSNKTMVVTSVADEHVVGSFPIGNGVDAVAYDAKRDRVFSSNGEGTLTVAAADKQGAFAVVETDSTQAGARTMALDEKTGRVYVVTASFGPPPAPTPDRPHPRPTILPGTFTVLVLQP
jgi:DNA-binding beta-propeller fold protein YncE